MMMDGREQRGLVIAATQEVVKIADDVWHVPSQSTSGQYTVKLDYLKPERTCLDHQEAGFKCKHIFAVEYTIVRMTRKKNVDGSTTTTTERVTVKSTAERKTYKQDWPNYNLAQANERYHFHHLLPDLCATIPEPAKDRSKGGRPSVSLADSIFAACLKVYSLRSVRRFNGELEEAHERGFIKRLCRW